MGIGAWLRILWVLLFAAAPASARLYNYLDIPIGERSFGLGGSSMAFLGDTSAIATNPSILALDGSAQFTASLSTYNRIDTRTGQYVSLFKSAADNVSRGGFLAVPSMVGGHFRWGEWTWGGGILVPQAFANSGKIDFDSENTASFESRHDGVWVGGFLARKFGRHTAGLTLFYVSDHKLEKFAFTSRPTGQDPVIRFAENSFDANAVLFVIGGSYAVTDRLRLGYSFRTPAMTLHGGGYIQDVASNGDGARNEEFDSRKLPMPMRLGVGVAWDLEPDMLLAADLFVYGAWFGSLSASGDPVLKIEARETANLTLGFEHKIWRRIGYRLGFFTNMSAAARVPRGLTALNDKVHMFGGTGALFWEKDAGTLSLGGYAQGGQGSSVSLNNPTGGLVPRSNYVYGFVVGSSYRF
jgi:hypothetical protein